VVRTADFAQPPSHTETSPVTSQLEAYSPNSGIKMSVTSNQEAIQGELCPSTDDKTCDMYSIKPASTVYTCGGQNGSIPVKTSQGDGFYEKNSCMVIEMEGVIDGKPQVGGLYIASDRR